MKWYELLVLFLCWVALSNRIEGIESPKKRQAIKNKYKATFKNTGEKNEA